MVIKAVIYIFSPEILKGTLMQICKSANIFDFI